MKITPLEIRQKDFEKKLRGYDKDEVNAFLLSLSNEWERLLDNNKELFIRLRQAEKEVEKLREVENSLFKTLKTAEQTGANVIDQANKAADLHMKETKMNAEALLNESKSKAQAIIEQAEVEARSIIEELQDAVKNIEQNYQQLENHRQNTLHELKNLSVSIIEKVELSTKEKHQFNFEDYVKRVKALAKQSEQNIKIGTTEINEIAKKLETAPLDINEVVEHAKNKELRELNKDRSAKIEEAFQSNPEKINPPVEKNPADTTHIPTRVEAKTEVEPEPKTEPMAKPERKKVRKITKISRKELENKSGKEAGSEENEKAEKVKREAEPVNKNDSSGSKSFFDELDFD